MKESELEAKYLGGMVGSALGDAIGELAFRYPDRSSLFSVLKRAGELRYTDDTAMAIGLASSLVRTGRVEAQHLGDTFSRNFQLEPWRGYAAGPPNIFSLVHSQGISYVDAARTLFGGTGSFGNGAAMRIVPVGLLFYDSADLYDQACASAEVTHAHPVGKDGAAIQAWAIAQAVKLDPLGQFPLEDLVQGLVGCARTDEMGDKMLGLARLMAEDTSPTLAAEQLGRTVAVHESMPFAIYSFLCHPNSFENCIYCAIMHGGDRDTLGAMAGAISGAYLGIEAIPAEWRSKLENLSIIENLALELVRKKGCVGT
jgi:poly(ADP-ribose) glycohydrolase ARH3